MIDTSAAIGGVHTEGGQGVDIGGGPFPSDSATALAADDANTGGGAYGSNEGGGGPHTGGEFCLDAPPLASRLERTSNMAVSGDARGPGIILHIQIDR